MKTTPFEMVFIIRGNMIIDISDKVIVITGSSRGIGREMAKRFSQEGAKVIINYNKSEEKAYELLDEINNWNKNCIVVKADVTKPEEVNILYRTTLKKYKKVDILINNAGICSDHLIPLMKYKQWKQVIDLNLDGIFLCSRVFSKQMIRQMDGKIFNIASLKGQIGSEGQTNYSASKAGVIGFTKALAKELGQFHISVNAVCPGFFITDLNKKNEKKLMIAKNMSVFGCESNLNMFIDYMTYICSDKFNHVSGQVFNIDSRL